MRECEKQQPAGLHVPGVSGLRSRGPFRPDRFAALMSAAVMIAILAAGPVSAGQEHVPVFLNGQDGGLSPFVIWRDSEEFKEVAFPPIARAMARKGVRAIREEPFRARFPVDSVPGERLGRWDAYDFLYYVGQVPVDDAGNTAPYVVPALSDASSGGTSPRLTPCHPVARASGGFVEQPRTAVASPGPARTLSADAGHEDDAADLAQDACLGMTAKLPCIAERGLQRSSSGKPEPRPTLIRGTLKG